MCEVTGDWSSFAPAIYSRTPAYGKKRLIIAFVLQEGGRRWEDKAREQNQKIEQRRRQNKKTSEKNDVVTKSSNEGRGKVKVREEKEEVVVIRSNGLTQTDRDYFNIVKTEDGVSNFFRVERNQANGRSRKQLKSHNFLYHSVRGEEGEKVAALYLPHVT